MTEARIYLFALLAAVGITVGMIYQGYRYGITEADVEAAKARYGCVPTNEFVGKDPERLYLCANGLKYPDRVFRSWAYEHNKATK
jgi:hypothetical protein